MPIAKSTESGVNARPMPGWIAVVPTRNISSDGMDDPDVPSHDPRWEKLLRMADKAEDGEAETGPFGMMMPKPKIVSAVVVAMGDGLDECPYSEGDKVYYTSDRGFELGERLFLLAERPFAFDKLENGD